MNIAMNQHYVPKFYLRNFSNNKKNIGMFRFVGNLYVPNASIKSVAYREYIYGEDGKLEEILSEMENHWNQVVRRFINLDFDNISKSDYDLLLKFIMVSEARSNKVAKEQEIFVKSFDNLLSGYGTTNKISAIKKSLEGITKIPNVVPIGIAYRNTELLYDLKLVMLINKTVHKFITSDNIVTKYNQLYRYRNYPNNFGLGTSGLQIFVVLSPEVVICLYDEIVYKCKYDKEIIEINNKKIITAINKLTVHNANEALFFRDISEDKIREIVKGKRHYTADDSLDVLKEVGGNGLLLHSHMVNVKENIDFQLFDINTMYKIIELPKNAAGLIRPYAQGLKRR